MSVLHETKREDRTVGSILNVCLNIKQQLGINTEVGFESDSRLLLIHDPSSKCIK